MDSDTTDLAGVMSEDNTFLASLEGFRGGRLTPSGGWPLTSLPVHCYKISTASDNYISTLILNDISKYCVDFPFHSKLK